MHFAHYAAASMAAALLAGCAAQPTPAADTSAAGSPVSVGVIAPFSGDVASLGELTSRIITMEQERREAAPGSLRINFIQEDGKCSPIDAAQAANKLVSVDGVQVILGGECSGETLAAAPVAEQGKVLLLSPMSSSPEVTTAGDYVFRTMMSDAHLAQPTAQAMASFKKIAVVAEQSDYAQAFADAFTKDFTGEIVRKNYLSDDKDYRTLIAGISQPDIEALLFVPQTDTTARLFAAKLQEGGWSKPVYAGSSVIGGVKDLFDSNKDYWNGRVVYATVTAPSAPAFAQLQAAYQERFGEEMIYPEYAAYLIDAIGVLYQGIATVGNDATALRDYLYANSFSDDITGHTISFDANGDVVGAEAVMLTYRDGAFVPVSAAQ